MRVCELAQALPVYAQRNGSPCLVCVCSTGYAAAQHEYCFVPATRISPRSCCALPPDVKQTRRHSSCKEESSYVIRRGGPSNGRYRIAPSGNIHSRQVFQCGGKP